MRDTKKYFFPSWTRHTLPSLYREREREREREGGREGGREGERERGREREREREEAQLGQIALLTADLDYTGRSSIVLSR